MANERTHPDIRIRFPRLQENDGSGPLRLSGRLTIESAPSAFGAISDWIHKAPSDGLILDLSELDFIDDAGGQTLFELEATVEHAHGRFELVNVPDDIRTPLEQMRRDTCDVAPPKEPNTAVPALARLGGATLRSTTHFRYMISFLGSVAISLGRVCTRPKSLRFSDTLVHMEKAGVDAVPIVALISFLLGLIMAFMSSLQLQQFGANIYVASLVSFAMVSELGPIMTAVVVAGRSGSAFAAEIGTMKISEEVDALFVMGFDPTLFLAVPRIIAAVIVVPVLNLFADLFAISGGMLIGVTMLDLSASSYLSQTIKTLTLFELTWGTFKSAVFALIVAWTGCLRGFQAQGGASAVGSAATSAVVTSIFLIVLFDSVFAVIRSYI